ncbi:hypothetical protein VN12_13630 [Pirellula sp. SH-Sr6A]|uniref:DUF4159 domain-containing protein n=1 Tax=Pirellula sp. SH-Sr6A TaxID=1632865 RepID=UPI00078ECDB2|nr:DUF4159 domain-containing protein [Pirellula sp. SH-Sr6A]AMV33161.1 hypothetical protein VN12_13630 [Pirellula sp. SH-Sr6A]
MMESTHLSRCLSLMLVLAISLFSPSHVFGQRRNVTAPQVEEAIRRAVNFLYSEQESNGANRGGWREYETGYGCGSSALVTLALLSAQERPSDPRLKKALDYLRRTRPTKTYEIALHCMALCAAEPTRDMAIIRKDVESLVEIQASDGGWGYHLGDGSSDESNAQFAVLALWEASKLGIEIPDACLEKAYQYWNSRHTGSGWGYRSERGTSGSMTCAGIASMLILRDASENVDARVENGSIVCCGGGADAMQRDPVSLGFAWLVANFSVEQNPSGTGWHIYYLYALERVGRLTGQRFFGERDWYREGASYLVSVQSQVKGSIDGGGMEAQSPATTTAMALLFLSKGKRQVVIGHLRHSEDRDWQLHRRAVQNLTGQIEKVWKRELAWQSVTLKNATLASLLETPVLYISGSKAFRLTPDQRQLLKEYIDNGGLIFAEACNGDGCDGRAFDATFRDEMQQIFEKPLTKLPPSHPVWFAETKIDPSALPEDFWLYGLDACCRTSVIYSPISLSCRWELARPWGKTKKHGPAIDTDIENAVKIGVNLASYATGRELKEKLDAVEVIAAPANYQTLPRGVLKLPKIQHTGGADDASRAIVNLLDVYHRETKSLIDRDTPLISLTDESIERYPLLYIHGRNKFLLSDVERDCLRKHFENGGFVLGDAICASKDFAASVRDEFLRAVPDAKWRSLDPKHSFMLRDEVNGFDGYDLSQVDLVDPNIGTGDLSRAKREGPPEIEALEWNGRIIAVFSPNDLSCAMESKHSIQCKGYVRDDAFRIGINMILFGLSQ